MTQATLKQLFATLKKHPDVIANDELHQLSLTIEQTVQDVISQQAQAKNDLSKQYPEQALAKLDSKSGCYIFDDVKGYFCPDCFDNHQQRVSTQRLNRKLRVCPSCRASIKPV